MQTTINLNPKDKVLSGKYSKNHDTILVVLDTRLSVPYSVTLPDLTMPDNKEFVFKNIAYGEIGADVTIQTVNNQFIDGQYYNTTVSPGRTVSFRTNLVDTWVLIGDNDVGQIQNPIYLGKDGLKLWRFMVDDDGALNLDYDTLAGAGSSPVWSDEYEKWDGRGTFAP